MQINFTQSSTMLAYSFKLAHPMPYEMRQAFDGGLVDYVYKPGFQKKKATYYAFILWPDNPVHRYLWNKIKEGALLTEFIYIVHPEESEGDTSSLTEFETIPENTDTDDYCKDVALETTRMSGHKEHVHVILKYNYSRAWSSVISNLAKYHVGYCFPLKNVQAYITYMVHRDQNSIDAGKRIFLWDDLWYSAGFAGLVSKCKMLDMAENQKYKSSAWMQVLNASQGCIDYEEFLIYIGQNEERLEVFRRFQSSFNKSFDVAHDKTKRGNSSS